jgi:histidyl-tRNA synthetase
MKIQAPKGTHDILPLEAHKWQEAEAKMRKLAEVYRYKEIRTPIFEATELFARGVGEGTDIVDKEMYTFQDKAGRHLTLRPEGTAPVVRACLEHNLTVSGVTKLYYMGPIFRYDRPQAGRYRQAHQIGVEALGSLDPALDAEVIALAHQYFSSFNLQGLKVEINSIGCKTCRPQYKLALKKFLCGNLEEMCPDCRRRFEINPLRILDCKVPKCKEFVQDIPHNLDYLCLECRQHFEAVQQYLEVLKIPYAINHLIVRGLDYYTRTVFEFLSSHLGAQNALCGGGRYDDLFEELEGKPTPAVGWALGIERTIMVAESQGYKFTPLVTPPAYLITMGEAAFQHGVKLLRELRAENIGADIDYLRRGMKAQFKAAVQSGARYAIIIGEDELKSGLYSVKDLGAEFQQSLDKAGLLNLLKSDDKYKI